MKAEYKTVGSVLAALLVLAFRAEAALDLGLGYCFSGTAPTSTQSPWVDMLFQDNTGSGAGTVTLTITAPNLSVHGSTSENMSGLYFNINPALNVTKLNIQYVSGMNASSIQEQEDGFMADGDGKYDILLNFGTGQMGLLPGQSAVFLLSYNYGGVHSISSSDFNFLSAPRGGAGPFYAAAHIQNTGFNGSGSGWVAAPEPNYTVGTVTVLAAMAVWRCRPRKIRKLPVEERRLKPSYICVSRPFAVASGQAPCVRMPG